MALMWFEVVHCLLLFSIGFLLLSYWAWGVCWDGKWP